MVEEDNSSLAESIVQYAERATTATGKVRKFEIMFSALEMGSPPQTVYFMQQMAYNAQALMVPLTNITVPPPYWQRNQQQQGGGKQDYAGSNGRGYSRRKRNSGKNCGGDHNLQNT